MREQNLCKLSHTATSLVPPDTCYFPPCGNDDRLEIGWTEGRLQTMVYPNKTYASYHRAAPHTPRLSEKTDSGKTHLQDLARWWRTSQRVDIPKISQFYWALFEKTRFLCFYIIKSMARKGYFGPKSDFRGSKIPPRGASST